MGRPFVFHFPPISLVNIHLETVSTFLIRAFGENL